MVRPNAGRRRDVATGEQVTFSADICPVSLEKLLGESNEAKYGGVI